MEASLWKCDDASSITLAEAKTAGEVSQMADGRACVYPITKASGAAAAPQVEGIFKVLKTASIVILNGGDVYWDHSADTATYADGGDRDFFLGVAVADAAADDTYVYVNINKRGSYKVDIQASAGNSVLVGTAAAGGFGYPARLGGATVFELTGTNEAQKVDWASVLGFAPSSNAIVEGAFRVLSDGSGSATDVSLGLASATHASDADSIAESAFIHLDGNATAIKAECDDGTHEVAATDTTLTYTEGSALASRVEFWIDCRDLTSVKFYVNGARVLPDSTFVLSSATNTWLLLAHVEKTSSTDTYKIAVDKLRVRTAEQ